jgi:hypothetical protein
VCHRSGISPNKAVGGGTQRVLVGSDEPGCDSHQCEVAFDETSVAARGHDEILQIELAVDPQDR